MKNKNRFGFVCGALLLLPFVFGGAAAYAASEPETAAAYLVERGIYEGDGNGNLNLDKGLTRAELSVVLTRLDFADDLGEWRDWGEAHFADPDNRYNKFTDVPGWALPYVEYCYERGLLNGVAETEFDPQGKVNPKMACTVILRYCGVAETGRDYSTSVAKAQSLGLTPDAGLDGDVIPRGAMAALICRGMNYAPGAAPAPSDTPTEPATPGPASSPAATPGEVPTMTIDEMKAEIVRLTNAERAGAGLPGLEVLSELTDCAQAKAQDFVDNGYFGHNSPIYGSGSDMIKAFIPKAKSVAENIATWTNTPQDAFSVWSGSQEHYGHIISPKYTHIGVGIVIGADGGYAWVQHFAKL
jgi:uncharacterized protein YkwD